jgi:hypothetical protein
MLKPIFLLNLCCLLLIASCSSSSGIKVSSDYNERVNYAALKSYAWYQVDEKSAPKQIDPLLEQRIGDFINEELASKNFTLSTEPDFLVNFSVTAANVYDINSFYSYSGYAPGFTWNRDGYGFSQLEKQTNLEVIREGSLVVDILDVGNKTIIWRGVAKKRLSAQPLEKTKRDELVKAAVQQVLSNFPPK